MTIIALIPARGGSKGIAKKNLALISEKPLIAFSINAAKKSSLIDRVIVSSDDQEVIKVSNTFGAETPFVRPSNLAKDNSKMIDVLKHTVNFFNESRENIEAIVLLQPTSPLRTEIHIDEAIKKFKSTNASSVVSVVEVPHQYNPYSVLQLNQNGELNSFRKRSYSRRQDKPKFFARNGPAILVLKPQLILQNELYGPKSVPYFMNLKESLDIDTKDDLDEARRILENMN